MTENYELSKEIVDFLYNGCIAFFPDQFYPKDQKVAPAVFYSGQNKETFEQKLIKTTQAKNIQDAVQIIKGWKIAIERGEKVFSTIPVNIKELVELYEKKQQEEQPSQTTEKVRESIAKAQEKKQATTKRESQQKEAKEQVEVKIEDTKVNTPEINLYSPQPQRTITLNKEQQEIVKLAHQDPQKFANQLKERIIETSKLNPRNPLETESAEIVAKTFALKLLNIDPKDPKITIDSSPFETLAFFANPKNEELAKIIPDAKAREEISRISLEALYSLEKDSTIATNFVNQAFGQDWSPFFIPPQIRKLEAAPEGKIPEGGINVNLTGFLEQVASFQTLEKQIKNAVLDEKTYNQLSKPEKARLETEIKKAAGKVSSATRAFSFITGKKLPPPQGQVATVTTGWLNTQFAAIGLPTYEQSLFITALNFGPSSNILSSPIFNFALDKLIKKIPAVGKLNTVVNGMITKLGTKIAEKAAAKLGTAFAANVIPFIGQVVSAVTTALSLKDIATAIKVWLKENEDKLPFILAGILVGAFALTGAPLYLVAGVGVIGVSRAASIGAFLGGLFFALTNIVLASLVIPMLIVFIGIPILVAIILFIINSGAYVYPPSTLTKSGSPAGIIQSEYVNIKKTADVDKISNLNDKKTISYTITITPKKGAITIKSIKNEYNITGGNNPSPIQSPDLSSYIGKNIDSSQSLIIKYEITLDPSYNNSIVEDIVTITVTTADGKDSTASTSHSLIIGTPPIDCPIPNGVITWGSYQPGDENAHRHGTNAYWGSSSCRSWPLPQTTSCYGPSDPAASANKCYQESSKCSYYGYAIDVVGGNSVYAPKVAGQDVVWNCSFGFANGGGSAGYTYICSSGTYRLILTHIKNNAKTGTVSSGEKIGELYPMANSHLHIEFSVNGQYVKPENYFCR